MSTSWSNPDSWSIGTTSGGSLRIRRRLPATVVSLPTARRLSRVRALASSLSVALRFAFCAFDLGASAWTGRWPRRPRCRGGRTRRQGSSGRRSLPSPAAGGAWPARGRGRDHRCHGHGLLCRLRRRRGQHRSRGRPPLAAGRQPARRRRGPGPGHRRSASGSGDSRNRTRPSRGQRLPASALAGVRRARPVVDGGHPTAPVPASVTHEPLALPRGPRGWPAPAQGCLGTMIHKAI